MERLRCYEVDTMAGTYYVLAESPSKAKTLLCESQELGEVEYFTLRARLSKVIDNRMDMHHIYWQICETCNRPCSTQRDPENRDLGDPGRYKKAVCEFCDPERN